jgi:hypothetical protein
MKRERRIRVYASAIKCVPDDCEKFFEFAKEHIITLVALYDVGYRLMESNEDVLEMKARMLK